MTYHPHYLFLFMLMFVGTILSIAGIISAKRESKRNIKK